MVICKALLRGICVYVRG